VDVVVPVAADPALEALLERELATDDAAPVIELRWAESEEDKLEASAAAEEDTPLRTDETEPEAPPAPKMVVEPMVEVCTELPEVIRVTMAEVVMAEEDATVVAALPPAP